MARTVGAPWLEALLDQLDPLPAEEPRLPADTISALLELEPVRKASPALLTDLARVYYRYSRPELIEKRSVFVRNVEATGRARAEVAKRIASTLERLGPLLVVGDAIGLGFETTCPDWRAHAVALFSLRSLAQHHPMPSPGRRGAKQEPPRMLARSVAEALSRHGIAPTEGPTGTFGVVLGEMLGILPHMGEADLEHLTDAIIKERKGIVRGRRKKARKERTPARRTRGGISRPS